MELVIARAFLFLYKTSWTSNCNRLRLICKVVIFFLRLWSRILLFKLVATRSVETSFLRGLRYANMSLTHSASVDRLLHKLLGYLSKVAPKIFKSFPKVAHFTKKLLKSCFLSTQKNQFLLLMKVNLCTSIRIIYYLYIPFYSLTFLYLQRWYLSLSTCVSYSTSVYGSLF